jgi:hypothetical protein
MAEQEQKKDKEPLTVAAEGFSGRDSTMKWKYTIWTTILFLLIANPYTFKMVHKLLGKVVYIANRDGCPTTSGLLVHAAVFALILRYLMG